MEFKTTTLENGLTLIGEPNPSAKSVAVGFFVRTGSRDESQEINGVSHFLEHMLFKGTDRLGPLEVNEEFDKRGAQYNAFTSEENTVFYAAVLPEYLQEVTRLWIQLMRPALRDDDFDMEKNVIKEEIAMYKDTPSFDVVDRCRTLHFGEHPCGHSVLGSEESIDGLSAEQMRGYFGSRYSPNNMVVACAGDFDWDQFRAVIDEGCGSWVRRSAPRTLTDHPGTGGRRREERAQLVCEHICLMHAGVAAQDERRFAASLLGAVIGDDTGSRYFWELVDKALAEAAQMQFGAMDGTGVFYSYLRCNSDKREAVMDIVRRILEQVGTEGVTEDELRRAKNKILSALVIKNELPMGRLIDLGFNWMYLGRYRTIEEDVEAIKAVTVDEVNALTQEIRPSRFTKYEIGPAGS